LAAQAIAAGADLILVAGGDGTINEAAQGIAGSDATLGILPAGTADVLAMETGLGHRLLKAAERLPHCHAVRVTTGRLTRPGLPPRLFLAMAGAGLDARIVRQVNPETKRRIGKLSYWGAALGMLGRALPEFDVRIGGKVHRASFALLSRVRNYGGDLEIARHADLLGGRLAVVLFEGPGTLRYLKYFSGVVLNKLEGMRGVRVLETDSAEILDSAAGPVDLQVDGESAGMTPALVDTCPGALRLLVPESFCSRGRAR
jgi:diacylglycerol kinase (ATP)